MSDPDAHRNHTLSTVCTTCDNDRVSAATTVFRLPPEPPVGTTVRPEPDTGARWQLRDAIDWHRAEASGFTPRSWLSLLQAYPDGLVVVTDPHPTPWRWALATDNRAIVVDANNAPVFDIVANEGALKAREAAHMVVDAVNKATP